jgi:hypothetical protein
VPAPAAHALLIRAPVHVPRDVRPAQAVRLHQRGELRGVARGSVFFFEVSCLEERLTFSENGKSAKAAVAFHDEIVTVC